jgi:transcriptional regulator with XRE-family HTH domain
MSKDFGNIMRRWRKEQDLTVQEAAEKIAVVKSTWSKLERGESQPSIETLIALSGVLGRTVEDLAEAANLPIRRSHSTEERNRRIAAMTEKIPQSVALIDLLPELTEGEIDTLLSVAESLKRQRKD